MFSNDKVFAKEYDRIIKYYAKKDYVKVLEKEEINRDRKQYLPHFAVNNPKKKNTQARIVYDASPSQDDINLNNIIHQGPKV